MKQRYPCYAPAQIATYLKDNALPRGDPDPNNTWGHGLAFLPHIGPVMKGDPRVGAELTADTEDVDDIDGKPASPTYTYQWIRVSSGGTETNISGATSSTYTPVQADVGGTSGRSITTGLPPQAVPRRERPSRHGTARASPQKRVGRPGLKVVGNAYRTANFPVGGSPLTPVWSERTFANTTAMGSLGPNRGECRRL